MLCSAWLYTILSMMPCVLGITFAFAQTLGEKFFLLSIEGHVSFQYTLKNARLSASFT